MVDGVTRTDQTGRSFRDKWTHTPRLAFDETLREGSEIFTWLLTRNGCQWPMSSGRGSPVADAFSMPAAGMAA